MKFDWLTDSDLSQITIFFIQIFFLQNYSGVSIKNIDILPNRQYIANIADSAQEQYS